MKTALQKIIYVFLVLIILSNVSLAQVSVSLSISTYGSYNVSCFGGANGWINSTPSGGTAPYTYQWSNGATTQNLSNISASFYAVTVTDFTGATATRGVTMKEPTALNMTFTRSTYPNGYNVSCYQCFNGSITVTPSGGAGSYSFAWLDGPTTQNRTSIGGGDYTVTMTDANGCTKVTGPLAMSEPPKDAWTMIGNAGSNPTTQYIGTADSTDFVFRTKATERIRVTANGNIGIGISPTVMLDVGGDLKIHGNVLANTVTVSSLNTDPCTGPPTFLTVSSNGNLMTFDPNQCSTNTFPILWSTIGNSLPNNTTRFIGTTSNHDLRIRTNNVEQMIVKADGKVGIGTSNPARKLEIAHDDNHGGIALNRLSTTTSKSQISFRQNGTEKWALGNDVNQSNQQNFFIWDGDAGTERFFIDANGKVGIGTNSPMQTFDVNGRINVTNGVIQRGGSAITGTSDLGLYSLVDNNYIRFVTKNGPFRFYTNGGTDPTGGNGQVVSIESNGKVSIGIDPSNLGGSYKLYVADGILTEKVKVAIKTSLQWSDFVFDKNYKIMPLAELEKFINNHKHLPEIPSAEDVVSNGVELAEMQAKLLQKIEELTLYVIELKKENAEIKSKLKY